MDIKDFENFLIRKRLELTDAMKAGTPTEVDVATKLILDYQELIAKNLYAQLQNTNEYAANHRSAIIKDNSERHQIVMKKLDEIEKKIK